MKSHCALANLNPIVLGTAFLFLVLFSGFISPAWCITADITLVSLSSVDTTLPNELFLGGQWRPGPSRISKLDLRFLEPQEVTRIELSTCGQALSDGIDLYINFDEHYQFLETGKSKLVISLKDKPAGHATGKERVQSIRTISLNFRNNTNLCLTAPKFFNDSEEIVIRVPQMLVAESPVPLALFDARLETAAKFDNGAKGLEIKFARDMEFGGLHVWNGDQSSEHRFRQEPRVRNLTVESETGFNETIELSDRSGSQLVLFKKDFRGRILRLIARETFGGAPLAPAAMSELQFVSGHQPGSAKGRDFYGIDIRSATRVLAEQRRTSFQAAGLTAVLDRSLWVAEGDERWVLRFRSDGTLFVRGHSDNLKEAKDFSFLGFYTIMEASLKGLKLKVNGGRVSSHLELDGSWCGRDCAGGSGVPTVSLEDRLIVSSTNKGSFFVRGSGKKRSALLGHKSLKMAVSNGDD